MIIPTSTAELLSLLVVLHQFRNIFETYMYKTFLIYYYYYYNSRTDLNVDYLMYALQFRHTSFFLICNGDHIESYTLYYIISLSDQNETSMAM